MFVDVKRDLLSVYLASSLFKLSFRNCELSTSEGSRGTNPQK